MNTHRKIKFKQAFKNVTTSSINSHENECTIFKKSLEICTFRIWDFDKNYPCIYNECSKTPIIIFLTRKSVYDVYILIMFVEMCAQLYTVLHFYAIEIP